MHLLPFLLACSPSPPPAPADPVPPEVPAAAAPEPAPPEPGEIGPGDVVVRLTGADANPLAVIRPDGSVRRGPDAHLVTLAPVALFRFDGPKLWVRDSLAGPERAITDNAAPYQLTVDGHGVVYYGDRGGQIHRVDGAPVDWSLPVPLYGSTGAEEAVEVGILTGFTADGEPCFTPTATHRSRGPKEAGPTDRVMLDAWPAGIARVCREAGAWEWKHAVGPFQVPCAGCMPTAVIGPREGWLIWRSNTGSQPRYTGAGATFAAPVDGITADTLRTEVGGWPDTRPVAVSPDAERVLLCDDGDAHREARTGTCGLAPMAWLADPSARKDWTPVAPIADWAMTVERVPVAAPGTLVRGWPEAAVKRAWRPRQ